MTALISVSPNPFTDFLQIEIEYENKKNTNYIVWLSDQKGKIIKMIGLKLDRGVNSFSLDKLQNLLAGTYYLDIKNTEGESIYGARLEKE